MSKKNREWIPYRLLNRYKPRPEKKMTIEEVYNTFTFTPREKEILLLLYYHRCMTSKQVARIIFAYDADGNPNRQAEQIARKALRKLYDAYLINRYFFDADTDQGTVPQHIVLSKLGAQFVAGMLNIPFKEANWSHTFSVITRERLPYLAHEIGITDFYIWLLECARAHGHDVQNFMTEQHIRHEVPKLRGKGKYIVQPDAYGQYWLNDKTYLHFFLEWDNGTMSIPYFVKKYERYLALYASDQLEQYGDALPYILVVAPTVKRAVQLRNAIYVNRNVEIPWRFTAREYVQEGNFLGKIWFGEDPEKPVSLLD